MPATSQISRPQLDKTATQVGTHVIRNATLDKTATHMDKTTAQVDVSRPRVSQRSSALHTEGGTDNDKGMYQGVSLSQDQWLPRGTDLSQNQDTNLLQDAEALSTVPHTSETLSLKVLLDEDKPDTQLTPNTSITQLTPNTKTLTKNFRHYVRENPAQTLCGLTITSLLTIVAILLGSSLTSTNARFAEVNTRFNTIDNKFDAINDKFNTMNEKFNDVNVQLAVLITALDLGTTIEIATKTTTNTPHKNPIDYAQFQSTNRTATRCCR